jgi:DNA modification methylase
MVIFRKPGENVEPVDGMFDGWSGARPNGDDEAYSFDKSVGLDISREAYEKHAARTRSEGREPWPFDMWVSVRVWQRYASPVWMDIDQTRTLQNRRFNPVAQDERDEKDEQHISPLQLDVIERCIDLWTNPNDVVLTPFLGIGSEVWAAVNMGRRGIGFELKPSYFSQAVRNLASRKKEEASLFAAVG